MPLVLMAGLMAIPFLDNNPKGVGHYSVRKRPFATAMFGLGLGLWCFLLVAAAYGWEPGSWVRPWESARWLPWAGIAAMGFFLPRLIRPGLPERKVEIGGLCLLLALAAGGRFLQGISSAQALGIVLLGWFAVRFAFVLPCRHLGRLGWTRYSVTMALVLSLVGVSLNIAARLCFGVR